MVQKTLDEEARYHLLKLIEQRPELSQRELAAEMGISVGKANYCIRALVERGWVKMVNFSRSGNKTAYLYKLTPTGFSEKARTTRRFLERKIEEHSRISAEIERVRRELSATGDEGDE